MSGAGLGERGWGSPHPVSGPEGGALRAKGMAGSVVLQVTAGAFGAWQPERGGSDQLRGKRLFSLQPPRPQGTTGAKPCPLHPVSKSGDG